MNFIFQDKLKAVLIFFIGAIFLFFSFKIFHYYIPWNYCSPLSAKFIKNTPDEIRLMKRCVNTAICEIGNIQEQTLTGDTNTSTEKEFICSRKLKYKTWK